jgi:hypothetical protein
MLLSIWKIAYLERNGSTTHFFEICCDAEEIHSQWQKFVSDKVGNYNVAARFNWHARNTIDLKQKLEYCETILESDSERLVEDAYRRGLGGSNC